MSFAGLFITLIAASGSSVAQTSAPAQVNCSDPLSASSSACQGSAGTTQQQTQFPADQNPNGSSAGNPGVYIDSAGSDSRRRIGPPLSTGSSEQDRDLFPLDPITDFQRLARTATGEYLPIFGRDLFQHAPSTFAPADQIPVTADYVIGPGDELLVRLWGPETFNSQLTVDTAGSIYIPKVGSIHVAGLRYNELQKQISSEISRIYRNFELSVNLGHLRSIQVYVVGEARRPGAFTISALSTLLNALFISGGPSVQGSMRRIEIRRDGQATTEFDLYDLVLHGDKSKDFRLQQGDTIYIPNVGPQIALAGSVRHPGIYESRGETTIADLLAYAGGYTPTALPGRISLERIDAEHTRKALTINMDAEGRTMGLRDGDVLFVNHISPGYDTSVTIRGNLANPGRFPWHPGMHLSEIIPDRMSLLSNDYWRERNQLGIPVPLFEPLPRNQGPRTVPSGVTPGIGQLPYDPSAPVGSGSTGGQSSRMSAEALALHNTQLPSSANDSGQNNPLDQNDSGNVVASSEQRAAQGNSSMDPKSPQAQRKITIPISEIDWSYAVVERLESANLKSVLLPFNLGKLVQDHDASQDLELKPGDVVTILSQADIPVPLDDQTKFIRLEGEFISAGSYSVHPGESLADVIRRAGGLTSKAYLYGSSFFRESARAFQQQRLDEYLSNLNADMERSAAVRAASSNTGILDPNLLAQQRNLISQLRQFRSSGRVVLEFRPDSASIDAVPYLTLENGDVFRVPPRPSTVSVVGAVYGQNVFIYNPTRRVDDYIALAGKPNRIADKHHAFIIRADGSVYSRERAQGIWSNTFGNTRINPGDSIVVPEKLIKASVLRELLDYSQIISSFGLAAAAISILR